MGVTVVVVSLAPSRKAGAMQQSPARLTSWSGRRGRSIRRDSPSAKPIVSPSWYPKATWRSTERDLSTKAGFASR